MGAVAVGRAVADGAGKKPSSTNIAITASPIKGSWSPYMACAESSKMNSDTPQVSGRSANPRIRAFRNLYLRRDGRTGRSGCVISSMLTLLWSLTFRVCHSEGVLIEMTHMLDELPIPPSGDGAGGYSCSSLISCELYHWGCSKSFG